MAPGRRLKATESHSADQVDVHPGRHCDGARVPSVFDRDAIRHTRQACQSVGIAPPPQNRLGEPLGDQVVRSELQVPTVLLAGTQRQQHHARFDSRAGRFAIRRSVI